MKMTPDDQKKLIAVGVFVAIAGGILYYQLRDDSPPAPAPVAATVAPSAPVGSAVRRSAGPLTQLDPTLRMGPMLVTEALVYSGTGRNIFSATSVPVVIPQAIAPARPKPTPPPVYVPQGPPPPPPIDLKFFGTATSKNGGRQAFLLHGEDVFLASAGDVVQRRYKVISVAANSIVIEDMTNNNRQTLPLLK